MKKENLTIRLSAETKELMEKMYGNRKSRNIERLIRAEAEEKGIFLPITRIVEEIEDFISKNKTFTKTYEMYSHEEAEDLKRKLEKLDNNLYIKIVNNVIVIDKK